MKRNIFLSYFLAVAKNSWFWLGIWVLYYLRFTNYAGIGLMEMVLITTMTLSEIPTGAIADLLGKKYALSLSFFIQTIGMFIFAFAPNFSILLLSLFILGIGGTFYSGTIDALIYDSLKENGEELKYHKIISNINSISIITPAICSIIGGFMYRQNPSLPYFSSAVGYFFGLMATLFLIEPKIDTIRFSLKNFFIQTKLGIRELLKTSDIQKQTLILLSIGFVVVIADEMLNGFLGVEYGFSEKQLGFLWAAIGIVAALASQLTPSFRKIFKSNLSIFVVGILLSLSLLASPLIGLFAGGFLLMFRSSLQAIFGNLASITINQNTESKFRATTLSTFNMIKNIPYVFSAFFLGKLADTYSARTIALYLGLILLTFMVGNILLHRKAVDIKS